MFDKNKRRERATIGTGSVADIAFLLLIFFLVATTIDTDKGIQAKLPPYDDKEVEVIKSNKRNVLSILVNSGDELLVRGENENISNLRERTKEFILNPSNDKSLSQSPVNAIVSLQNDRATSYNAYLQVYNELRAAYNEIWEEISLQRYGKSYDDLELTAMKSIRSDFPLVISEAEPTDFAKK